MLGKTHIALGIASALLITHPLTVPGVVTTITGGALGGWIVDVDLKNRDVTKDADEAREKIYDTIIDGLFICAFLLLDFFIGKGIWKYIIDHWGLQIWGSLMGFIILLLIGLNTKHRTFTHSFIGMALFVFSMYFLCRPIVVPFAIGYASHLVADFFNKLGLQLFFPLKWRPCLKLCGSDKKANKILFWTSFAIDMIAGGFLFAFALSKSDDTSLFLNNIKTTRFLGLNALQVYLIFINILSFMGFQDNWKKSSQKESAEKDKSTRIQLEFETWLLDLLVFMGGGIGMLIALIIHLQFPSAYNGNWWAFCYTSILFWFTVYCYICNPFGFVVSEVTILEAKHIPLLIYVLGINAISALYLYSIRKKRFSEYDIKHTVLLVLAALGGTVGPIPTVFAIHREGKYYYITIGFPLMMFSQIVFVIYGLMVGLF